MKKPKASALFRQSADPFDAGCMRVLEMEEEIDTLSNALAAMVNTFGTSHKELRSSETDLPPSQFQIATQQARDALALSGHESLIADHLIRAGVVRLASA